VKPGGTILLVGECREGVGQPEFGRWMAEKAIGQMLATPEALITGEAHRAYATALVMKGHQVLLMSRMAKAQSRRNKFRPVSSFKEAMEIFKNRHGEGFRCYVAPRSNALLLQTTEKTSKHSN
jgi:nickel-dependent lactate racemase